MIALVDGRFALSKLLLLLRDAGTGGGVDDDDDNCDRSEDTRCTSEGVCRQEMVGSCNDV